MNILALNDVCLFIDNNEILKNINLSIKQGELISILGVSGSGKTSLLNLIVGILKPTSGSIIVNNNPEEELSKHISYVQQEDLLLPWRTVFENMSLIYELNSNTTKLTEEEIELIYKLLKICGIYNSANNYPASLSTGMKQRVSFAQALLTKKPILLLDEPFSSLDFATKDGLISLIQDIHRKTNITVICITHDIHEALAMSNRILIIKNKSLKEYSSLNHKQLKQSYDQFKSELLNEIL